MSTPLAKPLTTTLNSLLASFAMLSVNFKAVSDASLEPTIAIDFSSRIFLFPFTYKTAGAWAAFKLAFNVFEYSGEVIGIISKP